MAKTEKNEHNKGSVSNPCIRHCCLDDNDICLGCYRSLPEILKWSVSTEQERRNILKHSQKRKQKHTQK